MLPLIRIDNPKEGHSFGITPTIEGIIAETTPEEHHPEHHNVTLMPWILLCPCKKPLLKQKKRKPGKKKDASNVASKVILLGTALIIDLE